MFAEIRKRLTLFNTTLTGLFLILLMAVCFFGLKVVFYLEGSQEVIMYGREESEESVDILRHALHHQNQTVEQSPDDDGMFVYIYDLHQKLIQWEEPYPELNSQVESIIKNWKLPEDRAKEIIISTTKAKHIFMMSSHGVYDNGRQVGWVYVGEEVTAYNNMANVFLGTLFGIGLVFLIAVYFIGNIMANKAMGPIYQSFERQRQFTADASHELRTPLAVLLSSTEAVITDQESKMSQFATQTLSDMKDEIKKINKLVANLLTLARTDAEGQKIICEEFDGIKVIREAVNSLMILAVKKNIGIDLKGPATLMIFADKERIYQLIYILLDNAIKYTPDQGQVIVEAGRKEHDNFYILVKDTGIGIPAAEQKRIFERFYCVDQMRSREQGGAGLGLSIAKWIVDAHEGLINVNSLPGQGT
ncbi:MAG TPA: histidine kinase, partial [Firmicutes bacterium]|nr:histidine kinase [Bacillota bacterium]